MGTRNVTFVVQNGEFKVAQYCQWDGYPDGQGLVVFDFIKENYVRIGKFRMAVESLEVASDELVEQKWVECGMTPGEDYVSLEVSKKVSELYPEFQRDLGAGVLNRIMDGNTHVVQLDLQFAQDSLFCEWAYVLDLDRDVLEIYKGFVKEPHEKGRFAQMGKSEDSDYYPIKLLIEIPFCDIESMEREDFTKMVYNAAKVEDGEEVE